MPKYVIQNIHVRYEDKLRAPGEIVEMAAEHAAHLIASGSALLVKDEPKKPETKKAETKSDNKDDKPQ